MRAKGKSRSRPHSVISFAFIVIICANASACAQSNAWPLRINEIMASNSRTIQDPNGQYDDWIEIYNHGAEAIYAGGMYLTDDVTEPFKWRLPENPDIATISPNGFLLVWIDADTEQPGLHAGFRLSSDGEEIALISGDGGMVVDQVTFTKQVSDVSWGRYADGADHWGLMDTPTPGGPNSEPLAGAVSDVSFSVRRGFHEEPFELRLTCATAEAEIWYTLDCSSPLDPLSGAGRGQKYQSPIPINRTSCVQAVAVKPNWLSTNVVASTYIFLDGSAFAPHVLPWESTGPAEPMAALPWPEGIGPNDLKTLPSVAIVVDYNDIFGKTDGIYTNALRRGIEWEREASMEWIDPCTGENFQINAGLRIQGGITRAPFYPKHSLRLLFKGQYGPATLAYPLFPDTHISQFNTLVLRGTSQDSFRRYRGQYVRDLYSRDIMRDMNRLIPHGRHVHVYINGRYWGLYILCERPDDAYAASYLGGEMDDYDVIKADDSDEGSTSEFVKLVAGTGDVWDTLMAETDLGHPAAYQAILPHLDVPAFIDYMLMVFYIGNQDGPGKRNYVALRRRDPPGPFVFLPWDLEAGLQQPNDNLIFEEPLGPYHLFNRLIDNSDFRMHMADRIHKHLTGDGILTVGRCTDRYTNRSDRIERASVGEAMRWGDAHEWNFHLPVINNNPSLQLAHWKQERDRLLGEYFPVRSETVLGQLLNAGLYPAEAPPTFEPLRLQPNAIELGMSNPNDSGVIYYTLDGANPRAFSASDGADSLHPGDVAPHAKAYDGPVYLDKSTHVKARILDGVSWSPLQEAVYAVGPLRENLRLTEIMYHPQNGDAEFIELTNVGSESVNLNLIRFSAGVTFTFHDVELEPSSSILVVRDTDLFEATYGPSLPVAGQYAGQLSNGGETLELEVPHAQPILRFTFDDAWYRQTDGDGYSLELQDTNVTDPNKLSLPDSWRASLQIGGSPGSI